MTDATIYTEETLLALMGDAWDVKIAPSVADPDELGDPATPSICAGDPKLLAEGARTHAGASASRDAMWARGTPCACPESRMRDACFAVARYFGLLLLARLRWTRTVPANRTVARKATIAAMTAAGLASSAVVLEVEDVRNEARSSVTADDVGDLVGRTNLVVGSGIVGAGIGDGAGSDVVGPGICAGVGSAVVGAGLGGRLGSDVVGVAVGEKVASASVGDSVVGADVGMELVGLGVVGAAVVGSDVVGSDVVGATVVGSGVGVGEGVGPDVVGSDVVGATVVGSGVGVGVGVGPDVIGLAVGNGVGAEVVGVEVVGTGVVGCRVVGSKVVGSDVVGSGVVGSKVGAAVGSKVGSGVGDCDGA